MKRTICKGCDTLLIPGMTSVVRSKCLSLLSYRGLTLRAVGLHSFILAQKVGQALVSELQGYPADTGTTGVAGRS